MKKIRSRLVDRQSRTKIMASRRGNLPHGEAVNFDLVGERALHLGEWQGEAVWLVRQDRRRDMGSLRRVLDQDHGLFPVSRGAGSSWPSFIDRINSAATAVTRCMSVKTEWAMLCGHCRERYYPQIAPCIIVAIRRDDSILLAQHTRHRNGVHTVLAGFVEVGETLEQAVAREVMEESGIKVKKTCAM